MCTVRTDFDVSTGRLLNQRNFQGVYCNTADRRFLHISYKILHCNATNHDCFYTICGVVIHAVNFLEITLILLPARSDVKIGPTHAHGNRLLVDLTALILILQVQKNVM